MIYLFSWKGRCTERRRRASEEDVSVGHSLPKWWQRLVLHWSEARSQQPLSKCPRQVQGPKALFRPRLLSQATTGTVEWEVELPGLEPVPIWDPDRFKVGTLTIALSSRPSSMYYKLPLTMCMTLLNLLQETQLLSSHIPYWSGNVWPLCYLILLNTWKHWVFLACAS